MTISKKHVFDFLIWALTVYLVSSFLILSGFEWGRYSFFACSVILLLLAVLRNNGKLRIRICAYQIILLLFSLYTLLTVLWSLDPQRTLTSASTMFSILVCFFMLYLTYINNPNGSFILISSIVASSYIVAVYSLFSYGVNDVMLATHSMRLDNEYSNINAIAMFLAIGFICDVFLLLKRGFKLYSLMSLVSVVVLAAAQSRKAIVMILLGILALLVMNNKGKKNISVRILRALFIVLAFIVSVYFISLLPIFSGVNERIESFLNLFSGAGKADHSSIVRNKMVQIGLEEWVHHPVFGIGIDATHIILFQRINLDKYLHNNYVELLCGSGVVGFLIYYSMYIYLLIKTIKERTRNYSVFVIGIILIGLILITDYGRVSYYSKILHFELMMLFVFLDSSYETKWEYQYDQ